MTSGFIHVIENVKGGKYYIIVDLRTYFSLLETGFSKLVSIEPVNVRLTAVKIYLWCATDIVLQFQRLLN